jgi:hypothetical protein
MRTMPQACAWDHRDDYLLPGPKNMSLRGYPETLSPCRSDIKQHSCGNETQGDHQDQAY